MMRAGSKNAVLARRVLLALPLALLASASSIAGAMMGLAMSATTVQIALGITILGIVALMASARKSELPDVARSDRLSAALEIHGVFHDVASRRDVDWKVHRTPAGLVLFTGIGMLAGMFGMGAGWANVPVLNLLMGAPLKVSAGTSSFILSLVDSAAAWVYLNEGAVLAVVAVPSVIGMMIGARIGAWASPQSEPISKTGLMARAAEMGLRHGLNPSRPPHWGGYRLRPDALEFWQGRPSRLHDRIRYRLADGEWVIERLAP